MEAHLQVLVGDAGGATRGLAFRPCAGRTALQARRAGSWPDDARPQRRVDSRAHYDITSPQVQASTCENFRMRNGANGADKREVFSQKFSAYYALAPDCVSGWAVYWMQSMPGYANLAKDDAGQAMLPW